MRRAFAAAMVATALSTAGIVAALLVGAATVAVMVRWA